MTKSEIEKVLEARIIKGIYKIGESMKSERMLAEEFGVSKTVIHEVMQSLSAKHFTESRARSGSVVADWVADSNLDIFRALLEATTEETTVELARSFGEFRVFNEGKCAALAAQNRTEEDLNKLHACLSAIKEKSSREEFAHSTALFHHLVFNATGNRLYAVLFGVFMPLIEKWQRFMFPDWQSFDPRTLELILSSIEKRDAVTAEVTMSAYMTESAVRLSRLSHGE